MPWAFDMQHLADRNQQSMMELASQKMLDSARVELAMASTQIAMASNLLAMANNLIAMASDLRALQG